eukprot:scaffold9849_cov73-Amphora_coffeaeformis.AAC.1
MLEASKDMFENTRYSSFANNPGGNVVRKLVEMGYSEIGAMRAASMTGSDFNQALRWAVAHSFEPGFNEPMVILKEEQASWGIETYRVAMSKINATRVTLNTAAPSDSLYPTYHYKPMEAGKKFETMEDKQLPSSSEEQTFNESSEKPDQTPPNYGTKKMAYPQSAARLVQPMRTAKPRSTLSGQSPTAVDHI